MQPVRLSTWPAENKHTEQDLTKARLSEHVYYLKIAESQASETNYCSGEQSAFDLSFSNR
jgi:hypothetical protein